MLDVVVGCTRKTEVKYWKKLFDIIGSPQLLFEECIERNKLTTAGGYLLVLHTLEQHEQNFENTSRLLKLAYDAHNWDLCKELSRFITATDPTGETLRKNLRKPESMSKLGLRCLLLLNYYYYFFFFSFFNFFFF